MSGKKKKRKQKEGGGVISWILILILLNTIPPVGVFLLIAKLFGHDFLAQFFNLIIDSADSTATPDSNRSSEHRTGQPYTSNSSSRSRSAASADHLEEEEDDDSSAREAAYSPITDAAAPEIKRISRGKTELFIFGWIVLALGIFASIKAIGIGIAWKILRSFAVVLGGAGMLLTARMKDKKERLYQNCVKIVGDTACIDIGEVASAAGLNEKQMLRELDEMLERGYFPETAYLDNLRNQLIIDPVKAKDYVPEPPKPVEDPIGTEETDKFGLLLKELERACGRITDRDMMEKAVQVRGLSAAIFQAVRESPEKQPQIGSFLNYYFPTTLKLLDSYADFEAKGYQGDKLTQTKERIETTMDTIIAAYRKQLDNLYLSDTLDVDTDMDVLETMLKRDGLANGDFDQFGSGTPGTMN